MLSKWLFIAWLISVIPGKTQASETELQLLSRSNVVLDDPGLNPTDWRWVREHQRLRLAVWQPMSPPYDITTGLNDYGGITADYLGLIAQNLNLNVAILRYASYDEALLAVKSGDAEILAQAGLSQQRAGLLLSRPYSENKPVEVINKDSPLPRHVASAALCAGYDDKLLLASYPHAKVITFTSNRHALEALAFQRIDLLLCDAFTTQYLINQSNLTHLSFRYLEQFNENIGFSFAAAAKNKAWIPVINKVLAAIPDSIQVEIHRRWNGGIPLSLSEHSPRYTSLERKWIAAHPQIRTAVVADNLPVSWFTPAGQLQGIIADILTALRLRTGFHFVVQPYPNFEAALQAVEVGESDIIAGAAEESIWQRNLLTTRSWLYNSWVMVGRDTPMKTAQTPRYVVQSAQAPEEWLQRHKAQEIDIVNSWRAGLERLGQGKSDIMIMPLIVANEWLLAPDYVNLKILGSVDTPPMRYSFGASDRFYPLITVLNKALITIPPEDLHAITRKASSTNELPANGMHAFLTTKELSIISLLCLVIGIGGIWVFRRKTRLLTQAARATRLKSEFLATMSHEIRTHISAVSGLLELVLERPKEVNDNAQRVDVALQGARALLALTGNILDVARIEEGKLLLHPERVSLLALIESVAILFESQATQKGLSFQLELDSELEGEVLVDPLRLRQIVSNLLSNAIKFTINGSVTLRATRDEVSGKAFLLRLDIEDSGKGIDIAVQRRLFQPFSQSDEQQPGQGSGLGLYICRRLADMMGGNISLRSVPAQGTKVTVQLALQSLAPVVSSTQIKPVGLSQPARQLTVLVVDDNPAGRMLLKHQLRQLGHLAICFASAAAMLSYLEQHAATVVITDCNMPDVDGYQLMGILQRRFPDLHVIGITADARVSARNKALDAGMHRCLFKPVSPEQLAQVLVNLDGSLREETEKVTYRIPSALSGQDDIRAFIHLQLSVLQETLAWLPDYLQLSSTEHKARLHRLRGGLQLLDIAEVEALCFTFEQHPCVETMVKLEAALTKLHITLLQGLHALSTVPQKDGDVRVS